MSVKIYFPQALQYLGIEDLDNVDEVFGYNVSVLKIFDTMRKNGIEFSTDGSDCKIHLSFTNPSAHNYIKGMYNIGYSCHESSDMPSHFKGGLVQMDEIWASSTFTANIFKNHISNKTIKVCPLGVSSSYQPIKRNMGEPFTFLHVGEPFTRKNGNLTAEAFVEAFGEREDVQLIFKTYDGGYNIMPQQKNIKFINGAIPRNEYIDLINKSHCLVFPSIGEGFGLIGLEALATGMPIISTWEWSEYEDFILNKLDSKLGPAPEHFITSNKEGQILGEVFLPQKESIVENMIEVYDDYANQVDAHYNNAEKIHLEFSWENITLKNIIPRLKEIYNEG